jgi:hypothetical protein
MVQKKLKKEGDNEPAGNFSSCFPDSSNNISRNKEKIF